MRLPDFDGDTFVAYVDISGFKMMPRAKALSAIDTFYSTGYRLTDSQGGDSSKVCGLFVSDCCVLFVEDSRTESQFLRESLQKLLRYIRRLNHSMIQEGRMLMCSIAYGNFWYRNRREVTGIRKLPLYGHAYVSAFLDCESGAPPMSPGQCRIVSETLPISLREELGVNGAGIEFRRFHPIDNDKRHIYYYWMVNHSQDISGYETSYTEARKIRDPAKYTAILDLIREFAMKNDDRGISI